MTKEKLVSITPFYRIVASTDRNCEELYEGLCIEHKIHISHEVLVHYQPEETIRSDIYSNFCPCDGSCKEKPVFVEQDIIVAAERLLASGFKSSKDFKIEKHKEVFSGGSQKIDDWSPPAT